MTLREYVKAGRESRQLSPRHLAELCGLSREFIYKIEDGSITNVSVKSLKKLAKGLGVKLIDIIREAA